MVYTKTSWSDGQPPAISAANLNKLETQYDEASQLVNSASNVYRQRRDAGGESFSTKLELGAGGNIVMTLLGDSTGNDSNEWFKLWIDEIAAQRPNLRVEYSLWSDANQNYPTPTVVQAGPGGSNSNVVTISDGFNRTASALVGTTPEIGGNWTGSAAAFSLNGSKAVSSSTNGEAISNGGQAGDSTTIATGVSLDTTGGSTSKQIRVYGKYIDGNNHIYVYVNVNTSGGTNGVSWGVFKRVGGTATQLFVGSPLNLANNAVATFDMSLNITGTTVNSTVNGISGSGTLTQSDVDTFANTSSAGIGTSSGVASAGIQIDSFSHTVNATNSPQKLTVYNGSVPGQTLSYPSTRIAAMVPVRPDVVFISFGHNYGATLPASYISSYVQFVSDLRGAYSTVPVVACSQNPEFSPTANAKAHLERLTQLRITAVQSGWGYLPALEYFLSRPDGGQSYVMTDGIHPTPEGSILWKASASSYLDARKMIPVR